MTNAERVAHFSLSFKVRPSTFVLRHFTIRVHMSRRRFSEGGFAVNT